jgi:hypothetical protein
MATLSEGYCECGVEASRCIKHCTKDDALAEVERLKALCAARPCLGVDSMNDDAWDWIDEIDAAGRGEDQE